MLRQRSSEVTDMHVGLSRRFPHKWLSSQLFFVCARARKRGVGADGWRKLHCEHGESVNRRGMQARCKETAKIERQRFNSEWARTFPGIRACNQSAAKACCVACNTHFGIGHGGRHDVKRHIERVAHIANAQSRLGSINTGADPERVV